MGFRWLFRPERRKERPPLNGNRISRRRVRLQIETEKTRIGHQPLWDELSFACKSRRKKTPPCMLNHTEPLCTGCCMYSARRVSHRGNFIFPSGKLLFPQWETFVSLVGNFWNTEGRLWEYWIAAAGASDSCCWLRKRTFPDKSCSMTDILVTTGWCWKGYRQCRWIRWRMYR